MSKLQGNDFKTLSDLTAAGGTAAQLLQDSQVYVSANGLNQQLSTAIVSGLIGGGSGGVGKNYISNTSGTYNLSGVTTFANGAAVPTTGTGGSPTLALSTTTTNPLVSGGNYLITPGALGDGVNWAFSINSADQAKMFQISGDYYFPTPASAHDGDYSIYIRDNTNGVLIYPSSVKILAKIGYGNPFKVTFQTASNSTSYSLLIVQTVAAVSTTSIQLANLYCGPQITSSGYAGSDWTNYTPTLVGFGTVSSLQCRSRRVGDSLEVSGSFVAGTTTAVTAQIGLGYGGFAGGVTVDTAKIGVNSSCGKFSVSAFSATYFGMAVLAPPSAGQSYVQVGIQSSSSSEVNANLGSSVCSSSNTCEFFFSVPIAGWSSNTVMSSDAGARNISTIVTGSTQAISSNATVSAYTTLIFPTVTQDRTGAYNPATGGFLVQEAGDFKINAYVLFNVNSASVGRELRISKNGVDYGGIAYTSNASTTGNTILTGLRTVPNCIPGDILTVTAGQNSGSSTNIGAISYIEFSKNTNPQAIAASETIALHYTNTSGQSIPSSTVTPITGWTRDFDTHSAFNPSNGTITIPANGTYLLTGWILYLPSSTLSNANAQWYINKNGSVLKQNTIFFPSGLISASLPLSTTQRFVQGDIIQINAYQNLTGGAVSLSTSAGVIDFSILRVGN